MHNEQGGSASFGMIPRALGPELFDPATQILSSREATLKLLRGEGPTDPHETAFQQEQQKIQEVLKRVFDVFKTAILDCNSYPELVELQKMCQQMWDFPERTTSPQVNFSLKGSESVATNAPPLYTGATETTLIDSHLSPNLKKAWTEWSAVWQRIREKSSGFAIPEMSESMTSFEGTQLIETFKLIQERAKAFTLIENNKRTFEQKAREAAKELFIPPLTSLSDLWMNIIWRRTTGEWKKNEDGSENFHWMAGSSLEFFSLLSEANNWTSETVPSVNSLFDMFWNMYFSKKDASGKSTIPTTFIDGYMNFYERLTSQPSSQKNIVSQSAHTDESELKNLQAHLKPDQTYVLPDGTYCYWGFTTTGERVILPVADLGPREKMKQNPTLHYFFRQAVIEESEAMASREIQQQIHELALEEGLRTWQQLSGETTPVGMISWLEQERNWFEDVWTSLPETSQIAKDALANQEIDQWWQLSRVEKPPNVSKIQALLSRKVSSVEATSQAQVWLKEITVGKDKHITKSNRRALRYLKLVALFKQLASYSLPTLRGKLSQSQSLLTEDLFASVKKTVAHLESGIGGV